MYPYGKSYPATANYTATEDYDYGYNGMEKAKEVDDNTNYTHFRNLDLDFGRWWSPDPLELSMPYQSPYISMDANPILYMDVMGDSVNVPTGLIDESKAGKVGYNSEGLNLADWELIRSEIFKVSGILLKTPGKNDKNLKVESINDKVGSIIAREHLIGLFNSEIIEQRAEIVENDNEIVGAENKTAYIFDGDNLKEQIPNLGIMILDLSDFRKWKDLNSRYPSTTIDDMAFGVGLGIIHETLHNVGYGLTGLNKDDIMKKKKHELEVIKKVNLIRQELKLPNRIGGHGVFEDGIGKYVNFDNGKKYYLNEK